MLLNALGLRGGSGRASEFGSFELLASITSSFPSVPLPCPFSTHALQCEQSLPWKSLLVHIEKHLHPGLPIEPVPCEYSGCKIRFWNMYDLANHRREVHQVEPSFWQAVEGGSSIHAEARQRRANSEVRGAQPSRESSPSGDSSHLVRSRATSIGSSNWERDPYEEYVPERLMGGLNHPDDVAAAGGSVPSSRASYSAGSLHEPSIFVRPGQSGGLSRVPLEPSSGPQAGYTVRDSDHNVPFPPPVSSYMGQPGEGSLAAGHPRSSAPDPRLDSVTGSHRPTSSTFANAAAPGGGGLLPVAHNATSEEQRPAALQLPPISATIAPRTPVNLTPLNALDLDGPTPRAHHILASAHPRRPDLTKQPPPASSLKHVPDHLDLHHQGGGQFASTVSPLSRADGLDLASLSLHIFHTLTPSVTRSGLVLCDGPGVMYLYPDTRYNFVRAPTFAGGSAPLHSTPTRPTPISLNRMNIPPSHQQQASDIIPNNQPSVSGEPFPLPSPLPVQDTHLQHSKIATDVPRLPTQGEVGGTSRRGSLAEGLPGSIQTHSAAAASPLYAPQPGLDWDLEDTASSASSSRQSHKNLARYREQVSPGSLAPHPSKKAKHRAGPSRGHVQNQFGVHGSYSALAPTSSAPSNHSRVFGDEFDFEFWQDPSAEDLSAPFGSYAPHSHDGTPLEPPIPGPSGATAASSMPPTFQDDAYNQWRGFDALGGFAAHTTGPVIHLVED